MQQIVIVGGGAGGLELATRLGRLWGKKNKAQIVLVDNQSTHLWKPLLHEVATGALDSGIDELNYLAHGKKHGFQFHLGTLCGLDRANKEIILAQMMDGEEEILPERRISYDKLVIALGSVTNDFGTKGAAEHCSFLDGRDQAEAFRKSLFNKILNAGAHDDPKELPLAIVGAGATGVELSAELHNAAEQVAVYGMSKFDRSKLRLTLIEAGPRILPALPERVTDAIAKKLNELGVTIRTNTMITEVTDKGFVTKEGELIEARLKIWAAGVRAPDFLANLDDLETNRVNQLHVKPTLQTTRDDDVFAIGDCSFLLQENGKPVPPRAQSAHQQAEHLIKVLKALKKGKTPPEYEYRDHGSMISLSNYSAVGNLIGQVTGRSVMMEGRLAKTVYVSLYRLHQIALHGYWHTFLLTLVGHIHKVIRPKLKLH